MPIISTDLPTHTSESEAAFTILAQCPDWVISGHWDGGHGCLLYSRVDIKEGNGKRQIVIDERAMKRSGPRLKPFASTIRNNRLIVVIMMTATAFTIPESGVSWD